MSETKDPIVLNTGATPTRRGRPSKVINPELEPVTVPSAVFGVYEPITDGKAPRVIERYYPSKGAVKKVIADTNKVGFVTYAFRCTLVPDGDNLTSLEEPITFPPDEL